MPDMPLGKQHHLDQNRQLLECGRDMTDLILVVACKIITPKQADDTKPTADLLRQKLFHESKCYGVRR